MALACAVFALLGWGVSGEFRTYRIGSSCILKPRQVWSSLVCSLANYFTARLGLPETSTVTKYETAEHCFGSLCPLPPLAPSSPPCPVLAPLPPTSACGQAGGGGGMGRVEKAGKIKEGRVGGWEMNVAGT